MKKTIQILTAVIAVAIFSTPAFATNKTSALSDAVYAVENLETYNTSLTYQTGYSLYGRALQMIERAKAAGYNVSTLEKNLPDYRKKALATDTENRLDLLKNYLSTDDRNLLNGFFSWVKISIEREVHAGADKSVILKHRTELINMICPASGV